MPPSLYSHASTARSHYIFPLMPSHISRDCVTTLLVANLHCSSCVKTIEETLAALDPPPSSVQVSIVSQSITVNHPKNLSPQTIRAAVDDVGFDVLDDPSSVPSTTVDLSPSSIAFRRSGKHKKHVEQCSVCQEEDVPKVKPEVNSLETPAAVNSIPQTDKANALEGVPSSMAAASDATGPFRVALSVGGMTCSSCVGTVTRMLSDLPGVSDVSVSLISKSATLVVDRKDLVDTAADTVDGCGFEVEVVAVESITPAGEQPTATGPRSISLRVDGMFCSHCPEKVMKALEKLAPEITVLKPIQSYTDPILNISYQPMPPAFTIRTIMNAVASAKSPPFIVSISHPPSLEERAHIMQRREQRHLLYRLIFAVIMAIPTFIIGIVYMTLIKDGNSVKAYLMEPMWTGNTSRTDWALFFLATPVMFYSAGMFHRRSIKEIRSLWRRGSTTPFLKRFIRFGSMNLLVSTGVSVAYFSSIALLALASAEQLSPTGNGDNTTYFDSVVFLTMFLLAGRFLEAYSKARTADAVTALGSLRPTKALVLVPRSSSDHSIPVSSDGADIEKGTSISDDDSLSAKSGSQIQTIDASLLEVGDIIRVQSGATPAADGTIVNGNDGAFDESSLTGESRLIKKAIGDTVFLGTINKAKMVDIKVNAIGGGTMLDHIVKIVREGQTRRAPIERLADLLTGYFVPVVTLLAIVTWVIWLSLGLSGVLPRDYLDIAIGGWPVWSLEFAIAVFVVACPCGIGLAAPTALLVGSGLAAKFGILARGGGEAFQEMAQLDIVVFDKTGTLTEGGEPRVSDVEVYFDDRWKREVILGIAAEIESATSHPLAKAIRNFCDAEGALPVTGSAFEEIAGRGLKAQFNERQCAAIIGNETWMHEFSVPIDPKVSQLLELWKSEAKSVVLLAIRDDSVPEQSFSIAAIFAIADILRPEAQVIISRLQEQGIGTWMISGDNETTAKAVAQTVGIPSNNVIAGVLPHEKAEKVQWLQLTGAKRKLSNWRNPFGKNRLNERCIVAMVGDGINDAPALAAADVGIAIGSGSDVAISSAAFILVSSNLRSLLTLSDLSRTVFNRVKFNFAWALVYNLSALPIAAGVIYPAGHARLAPVWASLAMALSSVSVVCSSLFLKLYKEPKV